MQVLESKNKPRRKAEKKSLSRKQVMVIGSSNVDLISYVTEHPHIGATVTGVSFEKKYGGKGSCFLVLRLVASLMQCVAVAAEKLRCYD